MSVLIGLSSVNITPPAPVSLAGQFRFRLAREVESPVLANTFAIENGDDQLIICSLELCGIYSRSMIERIRAEVKAACPDVEVDKIILCATHTHTGPTILESEFLYPGMLDPNYLPDGIKVIPNIEFPEDMWDSDKCREYIIGQTVKGICQAWKSRKKGYFGAAFGRAVLGHNRRACYDDGSARLYGTTQTGTFKELEAGNDSGVELLYLFDDQKRPMGALVNVACPAQTLEDMSYVSADYWAKVRDYVKKVLGEDFVIVGLLSAAGDQSPTDLVRRYRGKNQYYRRSDSFDSENNIKGAIEIGKRLGREILDRLPEGEAIMKNEAMIKNTAFVLDLPRRRVTTAQYEESLKKLRNKIAEFGTNEITPGQASDVHIYAGDIKRYRVQDEDPIVSTEIHIARLDDIAFASNPFELFLDYGNRIRSNSPAAQTFLIQLSGGALGYLPTKKAEKGSHYSAYVSSGHVGHEGGDLLVYKTLATINTIWGSDKK